MPLATPGQFFAEQSAFWRRLLRRDRSESGPIELSRRRVYILPSRAGLIYAVLLLAMLIGAINYQNSLAFVFTFLLTSLGLVSMLHSFRNLRGLRLRPGHAPAVFAGEVAHFPLCVENPHGPDRLAIKLMFDGTEPVSLDLPGGDAQWLNLPFPSSRRGYLRPGRITVYSRFPLGLYHTWGYGNFDLQALVYPKPASQRELPAEQLRDSGGNGSGGRGHDDFAALRPYHPGDSLRHVHWKALAREQGMLTKQFGGGLSEELWLNWEQTGSVSIEERLSRLTRWVLEADGRGIAYGLNLPYLSLSPQRGDAHRRRCLEALALFGLARPTP